MRKAVAMLFILYALCAAPCHAEASGSYAGRSIAAVIEEMRTLGFEFAYSTALVTPDMRVLAEPAAGEPLDIVREILLPYGLAITESSGYYLVVRSAQVAVDVQPAKPKAEPVEIENITVSSSRYDLGNDPTSTAHRMSQVFIQKLPDFGDDPVRAAQHLPGAASSGLSAQSYFRGGERTESGLVLNGYELLDPFHLRDFQSVFSVIDSRIVDGVEIYTGGFPVNRGNLMSGVVSLDTIESLGDRHGEIGISLLNTSVLLGGSFAGDRAHWLVSGRRGNLDLLVRPQYGSPSYHDIFAQLHVSLSDNAEISANLLFADDDIIVILADEAQDVERAASDTGNLQFWVRLDNYWSEDLSSSTLLATTDFANDRTGIIEDPERLAGFVDDHRSFSKIDFRQEWTWNWSDSQHVQWGFDLSYGSADYDYQSESTLFGVPSMITGLVPRPPYDLQASPSGNQAGLYLSDRLRVAERTYVELGLRWDSQNYDQTETDNQLSPRISLFHETAGNVEFRLSWGRYYQPQGLHELQIEDGVTRFFPAQRSDHLIAGLRVPLGEASNLRAELFQKRATSLRPRYENLLDPLNLLPEIEPDRVSVAPSEASARGIEIMLDGGVDDSLDWWMSYSWSQVQDRIDGRDEYRNWDQTHALQAGLNWSSDRWDFGFATQLRNGWPTTALHLVEGSDPTEIEVGPRNAERLPVYFTLDARVARRFAIGDTLLTTFIEVTNVTNRDNICCVDYDLETDGAGNPYLDRQTDKWLPVLPVIGFLWEF